MCINCRVVVNQKELRRFSFVESKIIDFTGFGRSFYVCTKCIDKCDIKSLKRSFSRTCKREIKDLEIVING